MTWQMEQRFWIFLAALTAVTLASHAQRPGTGDGLIGTYYDGENFERAVLSRRDQALDFQWAMASPAPGVPAEHFSVRWQGWLVPPATGRYILHLRVDDGVRVWLNGRQLVNEWRDQYFSDYTTPVELRAGEAYQLRIDYYQNGMESRMRLAWERPAAAPPVAARTPSWRNLWGLNNPAPEREEVLSATYLFSSNPHSSMQPSVPVRRSVLVPARPMRIALSDVRVTAKLAPISRPPVRHPSAKPVVASRPLGRATTKPVLMVRPLELRITRPLANTQPRVQPQVGPPADSAIHLGAAAVRQLANNEAVVLSALYFEQSQARLLPSVRQALDGLAAALILRPTLRLEVQGHTDNQGSAELNRQLSQQRAEAVCLYLSAHGVASSRLVAKGYGGTQPVADNKNPTQRPRNRRVVLVPLP
jgi:outer membrane protein OmpA-like peptidoglycan-associated protein